MEPMSVPFQVGCEMILVNLTVKLVVRNNFNKSNGICLILICDVFEWEAMPQANYKLSRRG